MQPQRHDITRRRTLKKKHELLWHYGANVLFTSVFFFAGYCVYRKFNPREYSSEEEEQKSQQKFGMLDILMRGLGYVMAFKEKRENKEELK